MFYIKFIDRVSGVVDAERFRPCVLSAVKESLVSSRPGLSIKGWN